MLTKEEREKIKATLLNQLDRLETEAQKQEVFPEPEPKKVRTIISWYD